MTNFKRRSFLGSLGAVGAAGAASTTMPRPALSQNRRKWRMLLGYPRDIPGVATVPEWFAQKVTEASDGRLSIELFGAGEIVPAYESLDAVTAGTGNMGQGSPYYWKGRLNALQFIANFPFGFTPQEYNAWYHYGGGAELCDEVYGELGLKFFPAGNVGVQMGGWFNREITSIDDFKGLKMRMPGLGAEVLREAGATVVDLPGGEVPGALASGNIDATEWNNPYGESGMGFYRFAKYYYHPGWHEPGTVQDLFINREAWDDLPKDLQTLVEQCAFAANERMIAEFAGNNAPALDKLLREQDVTLKNFPDSVLRQLGELAGDVLSREADKDELSRKVFDQMAAYLDIQKQWSNLAEYSIMQARNLDFPFPKGNRG